jgi:histidyl-tRNA synthetase
LASKINARRYNGTRDFLPTEMQHREKLLSLMRTAFRLYGFQPAESPAMEYLEILLGKYGDEDKLIYKLDYRNDQADRRLALRYDLTVPLARMIAMNPDLPMPFKRYQFQPVWRADRPQPRQGRFREFYQCDMDSVGTKSLLADAEVIAATNELMNTVGVKSFNIRINHRKLLSAIVGLAGLPDSSEAAVCMSIDKLEKVGLDGVRQELLKREIPAVSANKILDILAIPINGLDISNLKSLAKDSEDVEIALSELAELFSYFELLEIPKDNLRFDLYLARGLSYYTGPIFETIIPELPHMGSVMGGGRYDGLIGMFSGKDIPAVGATIGLDRLLTAMSQLGLGNTAPTETQILITRWFEETDTQAIKLAASLRRAGIKTEIAMERGKLKKQFALADKKQIPLVLTLGPEEWKKGDGSLKDMNSGEQHEVKIAQLASIIQNMLDTK